MKKYKYARIDLRSIAGIKKAERLQSSGWEIIESSIEVLIFRKEA